ncbi:hypothetical protein VKT23_011954 [Stygiomarasmius scandens]|uniref:Uncharacterized protein n=1 Tax=Marasmiellus scandens TaxID=2682957 RepID=A0ABR1JA03_9AGAR
MPKPDPSRWEQINGTVKPRYVREAAREEHGDLYVLLVIVESWSGMPVGPRRLKAKRYGRGTMRSAITPALDQRMAFYEEMSKQLTVGEDEGWAGRNELKPKFGRLLTNYWVYTTDVT